MNKCIELDLQIKNVENWYYYINNFNWYLKTKKKAEFRVEFDFDIIKFNKFQHSLHKLETGEYYLFLNYKNEKIFFKLIHKKIDQSPNKNKINFIKILANYEIYTI